MLSYHFTSDIGFILSLPALDDFGFLNCFKSGCYLTSGFLTPSLCLNKFTTLGMFFFVRKKGTF